MNNAPKMKEPQAGAEEGTFRDSVEGYIDRAFTTRSTAISATSRSLRYDGRGAPDWTTPCHGRIIA
jgi:hypothetical protein